MSNFNRVSLWREEQIIGADLKVHSDGLGGKDFRIFYQGRCCAHKQPPNWTQTGIVKDITFLEFFPISVAVLFGEWILQTVSPKVEWQHGRGTYQSPVPYIAQGYEAKGLY